MRCGSGAELRCASVGPRDARIVIVGEAPGAQEEQEGVPFVGASGYELGKMLNDAGIAKEQVFITNTVKDRPANNDLELWINPNKTAREGEVKYRGKWVRPNVASDIEELHAELRAIQPRVIIPVGNTALWALTAQDSISKWRGSYLRSDVAGVDGTVIPTYHPAAVLRQYDWRYITVRDLRRAAAASRLDGFPQEPQRNFRICPQPGQAFDVLKELRARVSTAPTTIVGDLEIKRREIVCIGLAWSRTDAACVSFYNYEGRTFTAVETAAFWSELFEILQHPNCRMAPGSWPQGLVNQNISFDIQYLYENAGIWPRASFDTMVAQNVIFPGTPKDLAYLSSLYADWYRYWKDDGKFWDKPIIFEQLWHYNCLDGVYTYEVAEHQVAVLEKLGLTTQMQFMMRLFDKLIVMMHRGVAVDRRRKDTILEEITSLIGLRVKQGSKNVRVRKGSLEQEIDDIIGYEINVFSPKQLQQFFYHRMGLKPIIDRKTKSPTTDDDALEELGKREPILSPITHRVNLIRSYKTAADAAKSRTSPDGRWRSSFNPAGTENYRLSSSENPFGEGLNLQNLTLGKEIT